MGSIKTLGLLMLCLLPVNVCVCVNTPNESLHSNFSILQDETWRKWSLIQEEQMFTGLIMDHTDSPVWRYSGIKGAIIPVTLKAVEWRKAFDVGIQQFTGYLVELMAI